MTEPPQLRLTARQARRAAIAAQGLGRPRPESIGPKDIRRTTAKLGLLQIDSVNVLARAHYLPLFSRLGVYEQTLLEAEAYRGRRRTLFEYWGHEASLIPVSLQPMMRWRMEDAERGIGIYRGIAEFGRAHQSLIAELLRMIEDRGPSSASDLAEEGRRGEGGWWGWSEEKRALEWLFWSGRVTTAHRRGAGFERVYDLTERVLPRAVLDRPTPDRATAQRALLAQAIRALGVATATDLRDYYRLPAADTKERIAEMVEEGSLVPMRVSGWKAPAYAAPDLRVPRRVEGAALLAPFDPLVWERARTERLFGFHYRLEIYVPAPKRRYGYYVLPVLVGENLVARLDLKADRAAGRLSVAAAHMEDGRAPEAVARGLAPELEAMARWLGLGDVAVSGNGALAPALRAIF